MNLLAFDTSTQTLSIGVAHTQASQPPQTWLHTGQGAAQASVDLLPTVLALLQQAQLRLEQLDAICFGNGPGAFTGLRTACAVAQGLAFGAGIAVLPVDCLLAVAEDARHSACPTATQGTVTAMLDARMDEIYVASYAFGAGGWRELHSAQLLAPAQLAAHLAESVPHTGPGPWLLAGNVFGVYASALADIGRNHSCVTAMPSAAALLRLAPPLLAAGAALAPAAAQPRYVRDKVAQTTHERQAEKAAVAARR